MNILYRLRLKLYTFADKRLQRENKQLKSQLDLQDKVITYRLREFERIENEHQDLRARLLTECSEIEDLLNKKQTKDTRALIRTKLMAVNGLLVPNAAKQREVAWGE